MDRPELMELLDLVRPHLNGALEVCMKEPTQGGSVSVYVRYPSPPGAAHDASAEFIFADRGSGWELRHMSLSE